MVSLVGFCIAWITSGGYLPLCKYMADLSLLLYLATLPIPCTLMDRRQTHIARGVTLPSIPSVFALFQSLRLTIDTAGFEILWGPWSR